MSELGDFALIVLVVAALAFMFARADLERNERLFIAWSGSKGAVSILLAAFAIISEVAGAGWIS